MSDKNRVKIKIDTSDIYMGSLDSEEREEKAKEALSRAIGDKIVKFIEYRESYNRNTLSSSFHTEFTIEFD